MNRRQFLLRMAGAGAGLASVYALKPSRKGAPYSPYFKSLNEELKKHGTHRPALLVDLDILDRNIDMLMKGFGRDQQYRIVVKSLPGPDLLDYIMKRAQTQRLMVFHQPFLSHVSENFPRSDVLMGKPMPVESVHIFYCNFSRRSSFDPSRQLQWLVDTEERLGQYQKLARGQNLKMKINVEIDVGLHRGGLGSPRELAPILDRILADPAHLEFSGFMGYDPHVVKIPRIISGPASAYARSQKRYGEFIDMAKKHRGGIRIDRLCLNGAGSPTLRLHKTGSLAKDLSAGSCLVKPTDFDIPSLDDFIPASFIAAPVLKKLDHTFIPGVEAAEPLASWWDPNSEQTFFIYGGKWMARYESPEGLQNNGLYGQSTNQHMVNGSKKIPLKVDDHIFLRPEQSEFIFLQFGNILSLRSGKITGQWPILRDS